MAKIIDRLVTLIGWRQEGADQAADAQARLERLRAGAGAVAVGFTAAGAAMTAATALSVRAFTTWESSFTGVRKTVEATDAQLLALEATFRNMALTEIPIDVNELAGIGEAAGQLGIETESIADFTRVMAMLGVTTNLTSEEAATMSARFAELANVDADDYERIGSVIVDLGNNLATTEKEILSMATRWAGTGELIGMSEEHILGLSAAFASSGIRAELGGTNIQKLMLEINSAVLSGGDSLANFAQVAGVSADEFSSTWGTAPEEALLMFFRGIGDVNAAGKDVVPVLESLGLTGSEMARVVLAAAVNYDVMAESVEIANSAWAENSALATEAALRFGTLESLFVFMKSHIKEIGISFGEVLAPMIRKAVDMLLPMLRGVIDFIREHPKLMQVLAVLGPAFLAVGAAVGAVAAAMAVLSFVALPVLATIAAVVAGVVGLTVLMATQWETVGPIITGALDGVGESIGEVVAGLRALLGVTEGISSEFSVWQFLAQGIAGVFAGIMQWIGGLADTIGDVVDAMLRTEEITWDPDKRQMAGVLRRQGLSGAELRGFMADNPDIDISNVSGRDPVESARFRAARLRMQDLLGLEGENRASDILSQAPTLTPDVFGGEDTDLYKQYQSIIADMRDAAYEDNRNTADEILRRVASESGRVVPQGMIDIGARVMAWEAGREAGAEGESTTPPALPGAAAPTQEDVDATVAAARRDVDATATAATAAARAEAEGRATVGGAAPDVLQTPTIQLGELQLPPEVTEAMRVAQEAGASLGGIQAAAQAAASSAGIDITGGDMAGLMSQFAAMQEEYGTPGKGPGGVTLDEAGERELTLGDVAGLRIQTAIVEQLVIARSPVPIEMVLQTVPDVPGAVEFTDAGLAAAGVPDVLVEPPGAEPPDVLIEPPAGADVFIEASPAEIVTGEAPEVTVEREGPPIPEGLPQVPFPEEAGGIEALPGTETPDVFIEPQPGSDVFVEAPGAELLPGAEAPDVLVEPSPTEVLPGEVIPGVESPDVFVEPPGAEIIPGEAPEVTVERERPLIPDGLPQVPFPEEVEPAVPFVIPPAADGIAAASTSDALVSALYANTIAVRQFSAPQGGSEGAGGGDIHATFNINGASAQDGAQIAREIGVQVEHLRRRSLNTELV